MILRSTLFATYPKFENFKINKNVSNSKNTQSQKKSFENKQGVTFDKRKKSLTSTLFSSSAYNSNRRDDKIIFYFGLFLVVALGVMAIITIKKSDNGKNRELEEELSAKDFKITE